jgi:hypothetical protein
MYDVSRTTDSSNKVSSLFISHSQNIRDKYDDDVL